MRLTQKPISLEQQNAKEKIPGDFACGLVATSGSVRE